MFQQSCSGIRESIYGVKCSSPIAGNKVTASLGSAFMISPGILSTCAHLLHVNSDVLKPIHKTFEVIRAPDIGQSMENARVIAEDVSKDIALLKLDDPRSNQCVTFDPNMVDIGTTCGLLGFPLGEIDPQGRFLLVLRFQGAFISSYDSSNANYEVDALMYNGSSGSPGFTVDGKVIGMQHASRVPNTTIVGQMGGQTNVVRNPTDRFAISLLVASKQIIELANKNGIKI